MILIAIVLQNLTHERTFSPRDSFVNLYDFPPCLTGLVSAIAHVYFFINFLGIILLHSCILGSKYKTFFYQ